MKKDEEYPSLKNLENDLLETDDFSEVPPSEIVAFNELRSCADLVRMYKSKQLIIQPDFQRDIVWSKASQTRFIDSLVKQLPIPSMCISLDIKTNERLMIDGLQRISSIINFLTDKKWKLSCLNDIEQKISGKTVEQIMNKNYEIYSRVENLTIPITVLRCDYSKMNHMHYLFSIFHRLNTGGNKLSNQEIRNCIFQGNLNNLLKSLVQYQNFRDLMSLEKDNSYRYAYEEFILRFYAFYDNLSDYNGRLAKFLNTYMDSKQRIDDTEVALKRHIFERTVDLVYLKIMSKKPLYKISKTTIEGIMIGISKNIDNLEQERIPMLKKRLTKLRESDKYSIDSLKEGLSQKDKVIKRLNEAISIFS